MGILKLHALGKRGGLGELRHTIWTRELLGFGAGYYASVGKVYIVQAQRQSGNMPLAPEQLVDFHGAMLTRLVI